MSVLEDFRNVGAFTMNLKAMELYSLSMKAANGNGTCKKRYLKWVGDGLVEKSKNLMDFVFENERPGPGELSEVTTGIRKRAKALKVHAQNAFIYMGMKPRKAAEFAILLSEFDRSFSSWRRFMSGGSASSR